MNRRNFLAGIFAAACAPAIVRADSLMRIVPRGTVVLPPLWPGEPWDGLRQYSDAIIGRADYTLVRWVDDIKGYYHGQSFTSSGTFNVPEGVTELWPVRQDADGKVISAPEEFHFPMRVRPGQQILIRGPK